MAKNDSLSGYKISEGPVTSSLLRRDVEAAKELTELPVHRGKPLLVAIARDPQTLFVCWSVDWPAAFAQGLPADRCAHLRIRQKGNEKTVAVEPMSGSCAIEELEPGETYSVELGYYAPAETWNSVVTGNEVMMPFVAESADELIDVASVPFHLTFQRILDAFRESNGDDLAERLAKLQERANRSQLSRDESEVLRALELSPDDLQKIAAARESLAKSKHLGERGKFLAAVARVKASAAAVGDSFLFMRRFLPWIIGIPILLAAALVSAQEKPAEQLYSPDHQYLVTILHSALPGSDPYSGFFTIVLRKGERSLAKYPTQGYLIDAFWSPDGKFVAVDNRRGNSGDYLWVFRLSDGHAIKMPIDAVPNRPREYYEKNFNEIMARVTSVYPELTSDQFKRMFTVASGWTRSGELRVKTTLGFRNLENEIVVIWETYKVDGDELALVDRKVEKSSVR